MGSFRLERLRIKDALQALAVAAPV
jgi:hypothetical protein